MQNSALQQLSFPKAASQKSIPPWTLGHSSGAGPSFSDNLSALACLSPAFWECPRPGAGLMILADLFQLRIFWAAFSPLVSVPYSSQGECSLSGIQAVQVPSPASSSGCFCPEGVRERMGSLSYHWFILLSSWCLEWESLSCSKQMDRCLQASAEVPAGRKGLNSFLFIVCFWNKTSWPGFFSPFLFFFSFQVITLCRIIRERMHLCLRTVLYQILTCSTSPVAYQTHQGCGPPSVFSLCQIMKCGNNSNPFFWLCCTSENMINSIQLKVITSTRLSLYL